MAWRFGVVILLLLTTVASRDLLWSPSVEDLVISEGYPLERHVVQTEDGYNLALYHIPHSAGENVTESRPVVYLQHGLLDTCATFLMNGPGSALGFYLVDHGFDIWLGNSRGNTFSNYALQNGNMNEDTFWDYSFDELAKYDLPASLRYVIEATGVEQLMYVGHSQGTAIAHALFSMQLPITERISVAIMLSPVAFVKHITSHVVKGLAAYGTDQLVASLGYRQFLPSQKILSKYVGPFCSQAGFACADIFALLYGYNPDNVDPKLWNRYLTYTPAGASVKLMIHWAQGVRDNDGQRFQKFDYGNHCWSWLRMKRLRCNWNVYKARTPPEYDLSKIRVPLAYHYGGHDSLADLVDVLNAKSKLSPGVLIEDHLELDYTHLDLIWGIDASWRLHPKILKTMKETIEKERIDKHRSTVIV